MQDSAVEGMGGIDGVPFARAYDGAIRESLSAIELRFLGLADFVTTKKASGRTKDLLDVELLKTAGLWEEDETPVAPRSSEDAPTLQ